MVEYLDPSIANEGVSVNNWQPGAWANTPAVSEDDWQPDMEPPHINDYAAFKKHKHYGRYFRPYRYTPFPAWMYHATLEPKIVKSKEEVLALGPDWSPLPNKPRIDMTGKALPVKNDTQRLAEVVAASINAKQGPLDATAIAAVVAGVMAAMGKTAAPAEAPPAKPKRNAKAEAGTVDATERAALLELASKENIAVEENATNDEIKTALGL